MQVPHATNESITHGCTQFKSVVRSFQLRVNAPFLDEHDLFANWVYPRCTRGSESVPLQKEVVVFQEALSH